MPPLEPKTVVTDTGPLFSFLTLRYAHRTPRLANHSNALIAKLNEYLWDSKRQEAVLSLFTNVTALYTTSHVIAELHGLVKNRLKLRDDHARSFWHVACEVLAAKALEEDLVRLLDMAAASDLRAAVGNIGPTDTALISLAKTKGCPLLTEDERTLAPVAWNMAVDCWVLQHRFPRE